MLVDARFLKSRPRIQVNDEHTYFPDEPILRHVERQIGQDAEDADAQVSARQVRQEEVDDVAHLPVIENHYQHQQVSYESKHQSRDSCMCII